MKEKERKIGLQMSILMGATLSFCLSLAGILSSGKFTVLSFLISFAISFVISLIIGFLVPMKKVNDALTAKLGMKKGGFGTRCFEALVSDIIYTPIITFAMVTMAYKQAVSHGAKLDYLPVLGRSMVLSMVIGYILIFVFMPLYMKITLKMHR